MAGAAALVRPATLGCSPGSDRTDPNGPEPTSSAIPADAAGAAAPDLLAPAGLALPDGASDLTVELVVHEHLREASVTTFTASQARLPVPAR